MQPQRQESSAFSSPYPVVGTSETRAHGDIFTGSHDANSWHYGSSFLVKYSESHSDKFLELSPCAFEGLLTAARDAQSSELASYHCTHIARYGGPVAARALRELIEDRGESKFPKDLVYTSALRLYQMGRGYDQTYFPEHALNDRQKKEVLSWLKELSNSSDFKHNDVVWKAIIEADKHQAKEQARQRTDFIKSTVWRTELAVGTWLGELARRLGA